MSRTTEQRQALRKRSPLILPGFVEDDPADEFRRVATWCEAGGIAFDHYGDGPVIQDFERKIATLLGKPTAVFMPSGIMAQLCAVRIHADATGLMRFGMHPTSHLATHEDEAYAALFGYQGVLLGDRLRPLIAGDIDSSSQPLACVLVELPIREAGGRLPTWDELAALKATAQARGVPLHMDGARLWESAAFYAKSHAEIADGFASVYVSVYKGIGGLAGAVLAGDEDFIANARLWRRRMGGTLHHLTPLVASAAMRFDERIASMPRLYERTLTLATGLAAQRGLRVNPAVPQTSMFHLYIEAAAETVMDARDALAEETGCWVIDRVRPTEVPGWSVTEFNVGDRMLVVADERAMQLFAQLSAALVPT